MRKAKIDLEDTCYDCRVKVGETHDYGCDWEECPFCGRQLLSCDCIYDKLGLRDYKKYGEKFDGLPKKIYENGPTKKQEEMFLKMLKEKGRILFGSEKRFDLCSVR